MSMPFCHDDVGSVLVVTSANPEMDWLAATLCEMGKLDVCVRRYAHVSRPWEELARCLPGVAHLYNDILERRKLPTGLDARKVVQAGVLSDFAAAAFIRMKGIPKSSIAAAWLLSKRRAAICGKGRSRARHVQTVAANYGVAAGAFQQVKQNGGRTILNYPNVHHRFLRRFLQEEAEREPGWAGTFSTETTVNADVLDQECAQADVVLAGSSFAGRTFQDEGMDGAKIRVVHYGCDTSIFTPGQKDKRDRFRSLFVGQLTQRKGLSYLLKAYEQFRGAGTELVLAGRRVGHSHVLDFKRHLFEWAGNLCHSRLVELYRSADVFVFPTLLEGLGLAVLEAMACGLPVVTTENGPGDLVRDGIEGFIVPVRDSCAIAHRLELLRANPELRCSMGRAARERVLQFTWERYCRKAAGVVMEEAAKAVSGSPGVR